MFLLFLCLGTIPILAPSCPAELPAELLSAPLIWVRLGGVIPYLKPLYKGPYAVLRCGLRSFTIWVGSRDKVIAVSRLKAFMAGEAKPGSPSRRGRPPGPRPCGLTATREVRISIEVWRSGDIESSVNAVNRVPYIVILLLHSWSTPHITAGQLWAQAGGMAHPLQLPHPLNFQSAVVSQARQMVSPRQFSSPYFSLAATKQVLFSDPLVSSPSSLASPQNGPATVFLPNEEIFTGQDRWRLHSLHRGGTCPSTGTPKEVGPLTSSSSSRGQISGGALWRAAYTPGDSQTSPAYSSNPVQYLYISCYLIANKPVLSYLLLPLLP